MFHRTDKSKIINSLYHYHPTGTRIRIDNLESMATKDISALDSVQRKCEKLCTEKISFEPLSKRRHRFDLIETYKFVNNKYKTDPQSLFSLPYRTLRGHKDKIFKPSARTDLQKFFSHRVVDSWHLLSSKIIEADTVDSFRRRLMRVVPSGEDDLSTK